MEKIRTEKHVALKDRSSDWIWRPRPPTTMFIDSLPIASPWSNSSTFYTTGSSSCPNDRSRGLDLLDNWCIGYLGRSSRSITINPKRSNVCKPISSSIYPPIKTHKLTTWKKSRRKNTQIASSWLEPTRRREKGQEHSERSSSRLSREGKQ